MKDIVFVQRNWKDDFFAPIAVSGDLDNETQGQIRYELGKEVEWLIRVPNPEAYINLRLAKIAMLIDSGNISSFDPYFNYRKMFLEYVLA